MNVWFIGNLQIWHRYLFANQSFVTLPAVNDEASLG